MIKRDLCNGRSTICDAPSFSRHSFMSVMSVLCFINMRVNDTLVSHSHTQSNDAGDEIFLQY